ncbi:MAG TPA: 2OG-Fe(II) oxygenase [Flavipsychrobacter sp.]|nr:2OG-Fe(II) oxygenase [Flavipsychrobacter sp.]
MNFINKTVDELNAFAASNSKAYATAEPFPNIYFDNLFVSEKLKEVLDEFPDLEKNPDLKFNDVNQIKLASKGEYRFEEATKLFMHYLNSQPFLEFLSILTEIGNLIPDPYFDGGGCHQILRGGMLKIHADFNKHPKTKLDRRINVLIYLNEDWQEEYGGHFELWDKEMKECKKSILPLFNRVAIFSTTSSSFHGHPNPLNCPVGRSRKSLALYYYTNGRPVEETNGSYQDHNTLFKYRKEDRKSRLLTNIKDTVRLFVPPILLHGAGKLRG